MDGLAASGVFHRASVRPVERCASERGDTCPSAYNACWFRSYKYDAWGNNWVDAINSAGLPVTGLTTNAYNGANRINGNTYDAVGNQTLLGATVWTYDSENHQTKATDPPSFGGLATEYHFGAGAAAAGGLTILEILEYLGVQESSGGVATWKYP